MDIGILKNKVLFQAKFSVDEIRRLSRGGTMLINALAALNSVDQLLFFDGGLSFRF